MSNTPSAMNGKKRRSHAMRTKPFSIYWLLLASSILLGYTHKHTWWINVMHVGIGLVYTFEYLCKNEHVITFDRNRWERERGKLKWKSREEKRINRKYIRLNVRWWMFRSFGCYFVKNGQSIYDERIWVRKIRDFILMLGFLLNWASYIC